MEIPTYETRMILSEDLLPSRVGHVTVLAESTERTQTSHSQQGTEQMLPLPFASSNADTVVGLRALADWLEQHPDISLQIPKLHLAPPYAIDESLAPAEARDFADKHTRFEVHVNGVQVEAVRQFGPIHVAVVGIDFDGLKFARKAAGKV